MGGSDSERFRFDAIQWQGKAEDAQARVRELEAENERLRAEIDAMIAGGYQPAGPRPS